MANPPAAPVLAQGTGSNLNVTWSAPAVDSTHGAATTYNLRYSPSGTGTWTAVPSAISPYTLTGLTPAAAYDVQIQSSNAAGLSAWSATSTLATLAFSSYPPGAPSLAQGAGSNLTVVWTAPPVDVTHSAAISYNVRYSPSGAGAWTALSNVSSPLTLTGLSAGAAYDVQVASINAAGTSNWSATSTLTTIAAGPAIPNAVAAATLTQGAGSNLTVAWTAPAADSTHSGASLYNLRFSPSGANTWTTAAAVTSPYTLAGLTAGAAYDVQIQSANSAGTAAWSPTSTLATAAAGPFIPNTAAAATLAQGTGSNLTVTWTAPAVDATHSAATGYNLRSSPSGANTWTTVSAVISPYTLTGLTASAAYDVQIQSTNAAGAGAWSVTSTLTTAAAASVTYAPNAPAIASVAPPPTGTNSQLTVTWTAPATDSTHSAATGYNVRYSPTGANAWTITTGVTSPCTLSGLAGAAAFDVEIQGTNAASSPGAWSGIKTGTTWGATVAPGGWVAAATQVHGSTSVAPNGGLQAVVVAAPTAVTGVAFAWAQSSTTIPTTGLIAAAADGQTNGWGQYCGTPATAGTFYLWTLAQGSGSTTIGALVTSAITVS